MNSSYIQATTFGIASAPDVQEPHEGQAPHLLHMNGEAYIQPMNVLWLVIPTEGPKCSGYLTLLVFLWSSYFLLAHSPSFYSSIGISKLNPRFGCGCLYVCVPCWVERLRGQHVPVCKQNRAFFYKKRINDLLYVQV